MISRERFKTAALFGAIRSKLCRDFEEYWQGHSRGLLRAMPGAARFLPELKAEALRISRLDERELAAEITSLPEEEVKMLRSALKWAWELNTVHLDGRGGRR